MTAYQSPPSGPAPIVPPRFDFPQLHADVAKHGVLFVDDCPVQRAIVLDQFQEAGISCLYEAADGEQALQLLRTLPQVPAIVVLDLNMPNMNGFEAMRQLAGLPDRPALLVLSGGDAAVLESISALAAELSLRFLGAVAKPLDIGRLFEVLARYQPAVTRRAWAGGDGEVSLEALDAALANGWIIAHYQPKVDLRGGGVEGVEALARWKQPDGTMIAPMQFIAVAEREGRIDALTVRMLDAVLADIAQWRVDGFLPHVSINVSCHSLSRREFVDELIAQVAASGTEPDQIIFEITESGLPKDTAVALACIGRLRMRGFGLSIDDYGTGFSSLQQLARMPFSELKVDRSFVRNANDNHRQRTILGSAIDIGRRLGMRTVAEGIETVDDLTAVARLGCDVGQGYLLAKPMEFSAILPWRSKEALRLAKLCREAGIA